MLLEKSTPHQVKNKKKLIILKKEKGLERVCHLGMSSKHNGFKKILRNHDHMIKFNISKQTIFLYSVRSLCGLVYLRTGFRTEWCLVIRFIHFTCVIT